MLESERAKRLLADLAASLDDIVTARRTIDRANSEEARRTRRRNAVSRRRTNAMRFKRLNETTAKLVDGRGCDRLRSEELVAIKSALLPLFKSRRENSKTQRASDEAACKALAEIAARVEDRFKAPVSGDLIAGLFAEAAGSLDRLACRSWIASPEFGRRKFATVLRGITHEGDRAPDRGRIASRRTGRRRRIGARAVRGRVHARRLVCYPDAKRGAIYLSSLTVPMFGKAIDVYQRSAEGLAADEAKPREGRTPKCSRTRTSTASMKPRSGASRERRTRHAVGRGRETGGRVRGICQIVCPLPRRARPRYLVFPPMRFKRRGPLSRSLQRRRP